MTDPVLQFEGWLHVGRGDAGRRETFESRYETNEQLHSCTLIVLA